MFYFAYGSNLDVHQMRWRCPRAKKVGRLILPRARLVFRGVADVIYHPHDSVQGGLWEITPKCLAALDAYEGARPDGQGLYRREYFKISVEGQAQQALIYVMNSERVAPPSKMYLDTIRRGYADFGLDETVLFEAVRRSYRNEAA